MSVVHPTPIRPTALWTVPLRIMALGVMTLGVVALPLSALADIGDAGVDAAPADRAADGGPGAGPPDGGFGDGGAPAPPDYSQTPVQGPALPPVTLDEETPVDALETEVAALTGLVQGRPPTDTAIANLFAIEITDDEAVRTRLLELRQVVDLVRDELDPLIQRRTAAAEGAASDLTAPEAARLERLELLVERAGLRLAVLSRPEPERRALLESEAALRRAAAEALAAEQARLAADEAARVAEEARQAALREAEQARTAAARQLAEARAGVEALRGRYAAAGLRLADRQAQRAEAGGQRADVAHRARTALARPDLPADEVDALHDSLVETLTTARRDLAMALAAVDAPVEMPEVVVAVDVDAPAFRALALERDAVARSAEQAAAERQAAIDAERADRTAAVPALAADVHALNTLRLAALPRLSPTRHEEVLGLGPQGLDQLGRELEHLQLMARWYAYDRRRVPAAASDWFVDLVGRASTRWQLLRLILLVLLAVPVTLRRRRILGWIDERTRTWARESDLGDRVRRWWRPLRGLAMPLLFLAFERIALGSLAELLPVPEVRLLARLVDIVAIYWLVIAAVHHGLVQLASRPGIPVDAALSQRLLRTVRIAGRTVVIISVFLVCAETVLGRGYLYTLVAQTAWLVAFPVIWFTLRHWQVDIFRAYLSMAPEGRVPALVRDLETTRRGAVLALPVALWLAARRMMQIGAGWALRLEGVRRALSFLFLRRLEKQAAGEPDADDRPPAAAVLRVIEQRRCDPDLRVDRFPRLAEVRASVAAWRTGAPGISWAVVGERGAGRTTWLQQVVDDGTPILTMERDLVTVEAVCRWLIDALGLGPVAATVDGVVAALEAEPRLILLDDAQRCARRAPGGCLGFRALLQIVRRSHRTAWVCTFSRYLWAWLMFAERDQDVFRGVIRLDGWTEEQVAALVDARMARCGIEVTYVDLMERPDRVYEREEELARTRERYLRLLWDYAEGLPELILHFWSRSLVDPGDGEPLRVRLFDVPKPDELEVLQDDARFALHAVVLHAGLDLDAAPTVLQRDAASALGVLEQLRALGCIERDGDRFAVPIHWHRAVVRFLRRKHLLAA